MGKHIAVTLGSIEPLAFLMNSIKVKLRLSAKVVANVVFLLRGYWMSF